MNPTSPDTQTKAEKFLDGYVEKFIQEMQSARIPSGFNRFAHGEVANDVAEKAKRKEIIV